MLAGGAASRSVDRGIVGGRVSDRVVRDAGPSRAGGLPTTGRVPADRDVSFDDNPGRLGAPDSLSGFLGSWSRAFRHGHPNAALLIDRAPAAHNMALLELRTPTFNRARQTLTFM